MSSRMEITPAEENKRAKNRRKEMNRNRNRKSSGTLARIVWDITCSRAYDNLRPILNMNKEERENLEPSTRNTVNYIALNIAKHLHK